MRRYFGLISLVLCWAILLGVPELQNQNRRAWNWPSNQYVAFSSSELQEMAARKPSDSYWQMRRFEFEGAAQKSLESWKKILDAHPRDEALRFYALNQIFFASRVVGESSEDGSSARQVPSLQYLRVALEIAGDGEKNNPGNGFYSWSRAIFLWGLKREDEAFRALEIAGNTRDFDDGSWKIIRRNERQIREFRYLSWDEKVSIQAAALLPHFAAQRALARQIIAQGVRDYQNGDKKRAYQKWETVLKAGRAMRVGQSWGEASYIGLLVSHAVQNQVWGHSEQLLENKNLPRNYDLQQKQEKFLRAFLVRARRDGQTAFASLCEREFGAIAAQRAAQSRWMENNPWMPQNPKLAAATIQINWVGFWIQRFVLGGVILWFLGFLILRKGRDFSHGPHFLSRITFWTTLVSTILVVAAVLGAGGNTLEGWGLGYMAQILFGPHDLDTFLICLGLAVPLICAALVLTEKQNARKSARLVVCAGLIYIFGSIVGLSAQPAPLDDFWMNVLALLLLATLVFAVWSAWKFRAIFKARWRAALEAAARTSGGVALGISVVYLVFSLALLPTKNELWAHYDKFSRLGEVEFLRQNVPTAPEK